MLVLPPDPLARQAVLQAALADRPVSGVDLEAVADATELFSGADLVAVCEDATRSAMSDAIRTGSARPISQTDLLEAARSRRASTIDWLHMSRNHAELANGDGTYDGLLRYLRTHRIS